MILPWLVATFLFILAYIAGMILSTYLFGISLLSIAFLTIAIIEVILSWLEKVSKRKENFLFYIEIGNFLLTFFCFYCKWSKKEFKMKNFFFEL